MVQRGCSKEWVYNNEIIKRHSLYELCHSALNDVSNRDYPGTDYFDRKILCLDMDTYEKDILRKTHPQPTMDAVIGVSSFGNSQVNGSGLLFIELRIGFKNISNLSRTEIERKLAHTKDLLGGEIAIVKDSVFVFNNRLSPVARRWFDRQGRAGNSLSHCIACSVSDFSNIIKSVDHHT